MTATPGYETSTTTGQRGRAAVDLPVQLEPQLQGARRVRLRRDLAEGAGVHGRAGARELRMVESVESLDPEFQVRSLAQAGDPELLEERQRRVARPRQAHGGKLAR